MRINSLREELVPDARHNAIPLRWMEKCRNVESSLRPILSYSVLYKMMVVRIYLTLEDSILQAAFYFILGEIVTEGPGWTQKHL